ncbi:hypothetical protein MNB_SV-6-1427 [hydrothermal vent metagenome]|uniref:Uncharacterized protein n=1 Tax=hydrothermal vent metagenome TaxID=652676 RepID=A0A1W1BM02_9ZZZZ
MIHPYIYYNFKLNIDLYDYEARKWLRMDYKLILCSVCVVSTLD